MRLRHLHRRLGSITYFSKIQRLKTIQVKTLRRASPDISDVPLTGWLDKWHVQQIVQQFVVLASTPPSILWFVRSHALNPTARFGVSKSSQCYFRLHAAGSKLVLPLNNSWRMNAFTIGLGWKRRSYKTIIKSGKSWRTSPELQGCRCWRPRGSTSAAIIEEFSFYKHHQSGLVNRWPGGGGRSVYSEIIFVLPLLFMKTLKNLRWFRPRQIVRWNPTARRGRNYLEFF